MCAMSVQRRFVTLAVQCVSLARNETVLPRILGRRVHVVGRVRYDDV